MKSYLAFVLLLLLTHQALTQDITGLEKSLDSLKALKQSYQNQISEIDQEYNRIQELINEKRYEQAQGETYYCISGTTIKKSPTTFEPAGRLAYGEKVKILDQNQDHFKILYNNTEGWVIKAALYSEAEYNEYIGFKKADAQAREQETIKAEQAKKAEQEQRKANILKKYGSSTGQRILDGKIWIGMTDAMALESWGKPNEVNRSVGTWGVHEQWVYNSSVYLYFENGKLTSWQD